MSQGLESPALAEAVAGPETDDVIIAAGPETDDAIVAAPPGTAAGRGSGPAWRWPSSCWGPRPPAGRGRPAGSTSGSATAASPPSGWPICPRPWATGSAMPEAMDPAIARATGSTDSIFRSYQHRITGQQISVIVLFGPSIEMYVHSPDNCYPRRRLSEDRPHEDALGRVRGGHLAVLRDDLRQG